MNKFQAEKKVYAFYAVFRVDVNDVKSFQNPTETSPFGGGGGGVRLFTAYQNDYVIDNYIEPAVI